MITNAPSCHNNGSCSKCEASVFVLSPLPAQRATCQHKDIKRQRADDTCYWLLYSRCAAVSARNAVGPHQRFEGRTRAMKLRHTNCDQELTQQSSESTTTITGIIGSLAFCVLVLACGASSGQRREHNNRRFTPGERRIVVRGRCMCDGQRNPRIAQRTREVIVRRRSTSRRRSCPHGKGLCFF